MKDGWSYRKVACPPPDHEVGRWVLTIEGDGGSQYECSDIVPLLRTMVTKLAQGYEAKLGFCKW